MGNQISLLTKITTIADSYDAMRSDRIYKKALTIKETIAELRKNKDTQYDPEIIDALLAAFKKNKFFLETE